MCRVVVEEPIRAGVCVPTGPVTSGHPCQVSAADEAALTPANEVPHLQHVPDTGPLSGCWFVGWLVGWFL